MSKREWRSIMISKTTGEVRPAQWGDQFALEDQEAIGTLYRGVEAIDCGWMAEEGAGDPFTLYDLESSISTSECLMHDYPSAKAERLDEIASLEKMIEGIASIIESSEGWEECDEDQNEYINGWLNIWGISL